MSKKPSRVKRSRPKSLWRNSTFKGLSGLYPLIFVFFFLIFGVLLVNGKKYTHIKESTYTPPTYTCCDSGNGADCHPLPEYKLYYKGIKASSVEEYNLLKSNVYLRSQDHHIDPDPNGAVTPKGEKIFYNPRSEKNQKDWLPECYSNVNSPGKQKYGYDDFIFGPGSSNLNPDNESFPDLGCYAIPNEQLIYVCRFDNTPGECEDKTGTARFDVYYRAADYAATGNAGIHETIKNCVAPNVTPQGGDSTQQIANVPDNGSSKQNLQLETFGVTQDKAVIDWISPYCKPVIYIYPPFDMFVSVVVESNYRFVSTIPAYPVDGWKIFAHKNGMLRYGLQTYDYLFYEIEIPDSVIMLPAEGFVSSYEELPVFLPQLVNKLGLQKKEIEQFTQYWLHVLPQAPYYKIRVLPQAQLDKFSHLKITPAPDTVIRVTLHFEPREIYEQMVPPVLESRERANYSVVEWGGIFKPDGKRKFSCLM